MYRNHNASVASVILRLAIGVTFILHGWQKISDPAANVHFFTMLGLGAFTAYFVSYVEFLGGILLIVGYLIKPVCVALAVDMAVVVWGLPGKGLWWGHEFEFILIVILFAMYALGAGKYSLAYLYLKAKDKKAIA